MRITKLKLRNFKRFSDLTIDQIPTSSKLVLLIGANGSGKSSVFDAFDFLERSAAGRYHFNSYDPTTKLYYGKNNVVPDVEVALVYSQGAMLIGNKLLRPITELRNKFIGRSSVRIVPRISREGSSEAIAHNADAPNTFIDPDARFNNDLAQYIQQIDNALREPVFSGRSADTLQIFKDFIQPLNQSLINILGGDELTTIQLAEFKNATTQESARLIFKKGILKLTTTCSVMEKNR